MDGVLVSGGDDGRVKAWRVCDVIAACEAAPKDAARSTPEAKVCDVMFINLQICLLFKT